MIIESHRDSQRSVHHTVLSRRRQRLWPVRLCPAARDVGSPDFAKAAERMLSRRAELRTAALRVYVRHVHRRGEVRRLRPPTRNPNGRRGRRPFLSSPLPFEGGVNARPGRGRRKTTRASVESIPRYGARDKRPGNGPQTSLAPLCRRPPHELFAPGLGSVNRSRIVA